MANSNQSFVLSDNNSKAILEVNNSDLPAIEVNQAQGSRFIVNTINERNDIPKTKRVRGMLCYVVDVDKEYILINFTCNKNIFTKIFFNKFYLKEYFKRIYLKEFI